MTKNLAPNATVIERSEMIAHGLLQKLHGEALKHDHSNVDHDFNATLLCCDICSPTTYSLLSKSIEQGSLLHQFQNDKQNTSQDNSKETNIEGIGEIPWDNGNSWQVTNRA